MQASTYQLLLPPVYNNWMWTDDAALLVTLIAYKWHYLSAWQVLTRIAVPQGTDPQALLGKEQAHGLLTLHLGNDQSELHIRLALPHDVHTTSISLSVPNQCLSIPLPMLEAFANEIIDWLAARLDIPLSQPAALLPVVESLDMLSWLTRMSNTHPPQPADSAHNEQLDAWLQRYPNSHLLQRLKAERAYAARRFADAASLFQSAIKHTPTHLFWIRAKDATQAGLSAMFAGQHHIAQRWLETAITWAPSLPSPHLHLGLVFELLEQDTLAIQHLCVYQQLKDDDPRVYYSLIRLLSKQGLWSDVVTRYQQLMRLVKADSWLYCDLGSAYLQMGMLTEARHWFEKVLDTSPANHPATEIARLMREACQV
jgi:tetratricopeptide (TPR) repeat protein